MIPRYFTVAESTHELQNRTSKEKVLLLGRRLGTLYTRTYLRHGRELLGWAIFVGWKRP